MNLHRNYKYNYNSDPIKNIFVAELKLIYRDDVVRRGYKSFLVFEKEKTLKDVNFKIEGFLKEKNKKLQSWEPKFFLYKIKLTNGLVARDTNRKPNSKFRVMKKEKDLPKLIALNKELKSKLL